jgi:hypothetical protein
MTAWPEARGSGSFLAAVATRAERWLLEPATPRPRAAEPQPDMRPVIAVVGLGVRCGTTTIARALAIEFAQRDRSGVAIVSAESRGPASALATASARKLARALPDDSAAAAGRLCLLEPDGPALRELTISRPAPVVLDVGHGRPPESPLALADSTVLVAAPWVEPSLADVVAASMTRDGVVPPVVLNRAVDLDGWAARHVLTIGDARLGARLALAGRDPTPGLARPIAELADALVGVEP